MRAEGAEALSSELPALPGGCCAAARAVDWLLDGTYQYLSGAELRAMQRRRAMRQWLGGRGVVVVRARSSGAR